MNKIAIINQRYGLEVNGGSEYYTRLIAEKLKDDYDIEILTTRANDYVTWANYYQEGLEKVEGISVRRFSVSRERNMEKFSTDNALILNNRNHSVVQENKWIDDQGPMSPDLIHYIQDNKDNYDVFIFVTYLYYLTVRGLPIVAEKSILIPTAHDEPYIYFHIYNSIFKLPKAIVYLTDEEKYFVQNKFHNSDIKYEVMGVGVDIPSNVKPESFRNKYKIHNDYIIYVGRIDYGKNCDWLFKYFIEYKNQHNNRDIKLVLLGKAVIEIPKHPDIINLGFVSEEDKYNGIAGAKALVLPSEFESLSISVLEALSLSVPVIVNGKCAVLKGHCIKSNAGLYYNNYFEFEEILEYMFNYDGVYYQMKQNAQKYIHQYYQWDVILSKFNDIISAVIKQ